MLFSVCIVQCVCCCVRHVVCSVQSSVFHIIKAPPSNWSFWMFKLMVFGRFLDTRPIRRSKLSVIHRQFRFVSTQTSLYHTFGQSQFGQTCTVFLDTFKYTNMYRPFGGNSTVQMDTVYMDHPNIGNWII